LTVIYAAAYKHEIDALNIALWSFATWKFIGKFDKINFYRWISLEPGLKYTFTMKVTNRVIWIKIDE
jgi:hypothetical protein